MDGLWCLLGLLRLQHPCCVPLLLALPWGLKDYQESSQPGCEEAEEGGEGAE